MDARGRSSGSVDAFVTALPAATRAAAERTPDLSERLDRFVEGARRAWPDVASDAAAFLAHVAARVPAGEVDPLAWIESLHADDLWLCFGAGRGDRAALAAFERVAFADVNAALSSLASSGVAADDVKQILRERLFVVDAKGRRRIDDYAGRGGLRRWVRAAAVHTALNLRRGRREWAAPDDDLAHGVAAASDDPELIHLRAHYGAVFNDAFRAALKELDAREQNLLVQYYVDGLTIDQMGALYQVNRVTAFRWVGRARTALGKALRAELGRTLGVGPEEIASIVRLVRSRLDITLRGALDSRPS